VGGLWAFAYENQSVGLPAIVVLVGALITAIGALWSSSERTEFERALRDRSDEIAALNRQIAASVTGGDSFCYVQVSSPDDAGVNTATLMLLHQGEYPLYNVDVRIVNLQDFRQASNQERYMMQNLSETIRVGDLIPGSAVPIKYEQLSTGDEQDFNVFINARNGFFTQLLRRRRVDGNWKVATRVMKSPTDGREPPIHIHEKVEDGFPRNERGEVDWE